MTIGPALVIGLILVFIIVLILIFSFTGHLFNNPYGILIIIIIGILLFGFYLILAYYNNWWPYSIGNVSRNNLILYITLGGIILFGLILALVIFLAIKHHKEHKTVLIHHTPMENEYNEINVPVPEENPIPQRRIRRIPKQNVEIPSEIRNQEVLNDLPDEELGVEAEQDLTREQIERLILENQLEREGLIEESPEIEERNRLLMKELEEREISENVLREGTDLATLKEIAAQRALKTALPSVTMFGPNGSENQINRLRRVPENLEPLVQQEELKQEEQRRLEEQRLEKERRVEIDRPSEISYQTRLSNKLLEEQRARNEQRIRLENEERIRNQEQINRLRREYQEPEEDEDEKIEGFETPEREMEFNQEKNDEFEEKNESEPLEESGGAEENEAENLINEEESKEPSGLFNELESKVEEAPELEEGLEEGVEAAE